MGTRLSRGDKSEMRWYDVFCQAFLAYHASHNDDDDNFDSDCNFCFDFQYGIPQDPKPILTIASVIIPYTIIPYTILPQMCASHCKTQKIYILVKLLMYVMSSQGKCV